MPDDVFIRSPLKAPFGAGLTLPSQCHLGRRRVHRHVCGSKNLFPRSRRAQSRLGKSHMTCGGARRVRTDDLMLAKHALYQLSYGPSGAPSGQAMGRGDLVGQRRLGNASRRGRVVGPGGLEPPTSRLSGVCSNQLSYRPELQARALAIASQPQDTRARLARSAVLAGMSVERETETAAFRTCSGVFERPNSVVRPGGTSLERR